VIGLGLVLEKGTYFRDAWNIMDFTIVVLGYVSMIGSSDIKVSALRSLRVIRPLRTISNV
jgi:hypothetical protein